MMKAFIANLFIIHAMLISCGSLPKIESVDSNIYPHIKKECSLPFFAKKCRLVHSIEATLPDGSMSSAIGVAIADPDADTIHGVIMTIEGVVLFDALYSGGTLSIERGVPPFNSTDFAGSIMDDMRLIFFIPEGNPYETGKLENGALICRYRKDDGNVIDVVRNSDGSWELQQYSNYHNLLRTIRFFTPNKLGIPKEIELTAHGFFGYSLYFTLLEFEFID